MKKRYSQEQIFKAIRKQVRRAGSERGPVAARTGVRERQAEEAVGRSAARSRGHEGALAKKS